METRIFLEGWEANSDWEKSGTTLAERTLRAHRQTLRATCLRYPSRVMCDAPPTTGQTKARVPKSSLHTWAIKRAQRASGAAPNVASHSLVALSMALPKARPTAATASDSTSARSPFKLASSTSPKQAPITGERRCMRIMGGVQPTRAPSFASCLTVFRNRELFTNSVATRARRVRVAGCWIRSK